MFNWLRIIGFITLNLSLNLWGAAESESIDRVESAQQSSTGSVTLASDYITRGLTQTEHAPALQGSVDFSYGGFFAGVWGSNIYFPDSISRVELDVYGGYTVQFLPSLSLSVGLNRFHCLPDSQINAWSIPVELKWKNVLAEFHYSPHTDEGVGASAYSKIGYTQPLASEFNLVGSVGYSVFAATLEKTNYMDFRMGLSKSLFDIDFELAASTTNLPIEEKAGATRLFLTASKNL